MDSARACKLSPSSESEDAARISSHPNYPPNPGIPDVAPATAQPHRDPGDPLLPGTPVSTSKTNMLQPFCKHSHALPACLPPSTVAGGHRAAVDISCSGTIGTIAASLPHGPAASGSVHDDNFLQPHGLAVMDLGGMQKSPFIDDTREISRSVTSPSQNSSLPSLDLPDHLGLPEYQQEPPRQREVSALSAVLQSVASSQAEEMRRQASTVSWVPRDPSGFHLGTIENIVEVPAPGPTPSPRPPMALATVEPSHEMAVLRARYRAADTAVAGPYGYAATRIQCSCRPLPASTQSGEAAAAGRHACAPWGPLSPAEAAADAAAGTFTSRAAATLRPTSRSLHPDEQGAMLRLCGASAAEYGVVFVPPGLPAALQALANLLGLQKWLQCAAMETCPEEAAAGVAKVGSLFRSRSVRLQRQSANGSVRPVIFYGIHDHEAQGEFWSRIDCEVVVRPSLPPMHVPP